jgi:hypothetical protein
MRLPALFICLWGCAGLGAATMTLFSEDFSGPVIPPGWTISGPGPAAWSREYTDHAGGSAGEIRLGPNPPAPGTYRFITPPIDTRHVYDMALSFKHALDDSPANPNAYTIAVELTNNLSDWTTLWSQNVFWDIPPETVEVFIDHSLGQSPSTRLAYTFIGDNADINGWYIDDVLLTYRGTIYAGIWDAGSHYPAGDVVILDGSTLQVSAGASVYLDAEARIRVMGRLLVSGTDIQPVLFTRESAVEPWWGIRIEEVASDNDSTLIDHARVEKCEQTAVFISYTDKVRLSHCQITENDLGSDEHVPVYLNCSNAVMEHCDIFGNYNDLGLPGLAVMQGTPGIRHCRVFANNALTNDPAVILGYCDISGFHDNIVACNNRSGLMVCYCWGTLRRCLLANNGYCGLDTFYSELGAEGCDIVHNGVGISSQSFLMLDNTIVWGNGSGIYNLLTPWSLAISYCCVQGGGDGILGGTIAEENYTHNTSSDPELMAPTAGYGSDYDALAADWRISHISPCLDAGDPALGLNSDGSPWDIGLYQRACKPVITAALDYFPDQGRQLDLHWARSDIDNTFYPFAFYSVWRQEQGPAGEALLISDPAQLPAALASGARHIRLREGNRLWYYLLQVPAVTFPEYGLLVPTPQDSSASGLHAMDYLVMYHNADGFWSSLPQAGYSVDNIPPLSPTRLALERISGSELRLSWDPVTEGCWEGNTYPELNQITYRIHVSDHPDFEPGPDTYLTTVSNPVAVLGCQGSQRRFYRIVACDSD